MNERLLPATSETIPRLGEVGADSNDLRPSDTSTQDDKSPSSYNPANEEANERRGTLPPVEVESDFGSNLDIIMKRQQANDQMDYTLRQFVATPDISNTRESAEDVPNIVVEEGSGTEVARFVSSAEIDSESHLEEQPGAALTRMPSPVPGKRPGQVPFMAYVVDAAVEKKRLDQALDAVPSRSHFKSSLAICDPANASKMSLVAEIIRTDSYGNKLRVVPTSKGRYQPIGPDEHSLLSPSELKQQRSKSQMDCEEAKLERNSMAFSKKTKDEEAPVQTAPLRSAPEQTEAPRKECVPPVGPKKNQDQSQEQNQKSNSGMAATVGVLTSLIKWQIKSKKEKNANEKYPGYLDLFNRLSNELNTSVPFPLLLQCRREALLIVLNIAKAYKSTLGPHHMMTEEAFTKVEKLRSSLQDSDVFL
ncbi:uncharacterized protein [Diadema setosum]|uniref:uncharacterized protein n=1 Tax=Diadema setosum TaxID=31175 RepID=UPI003B3B91F2